MITGAQPILITAADAASRTIVLPIGQTLDVNVGTSEVAQQLQEIYRVTGVVPARARQATASGTISPL